MPQVKVDLSQISRSLRRRRSTGNGRATALQRMATLDARPSDYDDTNRFSDEDRDTHVTRLRMMFRNMKMSRSHSQNAEYWLLNIAQRPSVGSLRPMAKGVIVDKDRAKEAFRPVPSTEGRIRTLGRWTTSPTGVCFTEGRRKVHLTSKGQPALVKMGKVALGSHNVDVIERQLFEQFFGKKTTRKRSRKAKEAQRHKSAAASEFVNTAPETCFSFTDEERRAGLAPTSDYGVHVNDTYSDKAVAAKRYWCEVFALWRDDACYCKDIKNGCECAPARNTGRVRGKRPA